MGNIGSWLRHMGEGFKKTARRFMEGRYGTDKLNIFLLRTAFVLMLIDLFLPVGLLKLVFWLLPMGLMVWSILRSFSRNIYRRYGENRKYLQLMDAVRDRQHRYFNCPKCRQRVRVPRGKGKIAITCPKCREKFVKKT